MADQQCREKLIDAALDLCMRRGYDATTVEQIAAAAGVTPDTFGRYFANKDGVVLSVAEDILHGAAAALAGVPPNTNPLEALLIAHTKILEAITNGVGVITRERLRMMAHILTASPHLQKQTDALARLVLTVALAEHMGVGLDDRRVRLPVTLWRAVIAVAGNMDLGGASADPCQDGRVPEAMVGRLNDTFTHLTALAVP
jgi:AcrR family transcriptional regulator